MGVPRTVYYIIMSAPVCVRGFRQSYGDYLDHLPDSGVNHDSATFAIISARLSLDVHMYLKCLR